MHSLIINERKDMYIPAVLDRWDNSYYSNSYLHGDYWFVGTPTSQERKVLAGSYTRLRPVPALAAWATLAGLGVAAIVTGCVVWIIIVLFVASVLSSVGILVGSDAYRRRRRVDLLKKKGLVVSNVTYRDSEKDCRIEALDMKRPSHISWPSLGSDTVSKGEIDMFLNDPVVVNARAYLVRGKIDMDETQNLNHALRVAAEATFSRVSKYEEERNGCSMSVEDVVKSLMAQASPELTK